MKKMSALLLPAVFVLALAPASLPAGWNGPETVVSGTWGQADGQFTIESTDMGDIYPTEFFVLDDGTIVIQDGKLKVYRNNRFAGALDFDGRIEFCDEAIVVLPWKREDGGPAEKDLSFHPSGGREGWKVPAAQLIGRLDRVDRDCTFMTVDEEKVYRQYSRTGKLIRTVLHPGRIKHERLNNGRYRISITYDDMTYSFLHQDEYAYGSYARDRNELLSGISGSRVDVLDRCGKVIDGMELPKDLRFEGEGGHSRDRDEFVHDEYGEPFVDIHGNVYAWKRTPSSFNILKWTRRPGPVSPAVPDPPAAPMAVQAASGLYLTWIASPQDPGCVTGYEIRRASDRCGPFVPVATVERGVLKYRDAAAEQGGTYHYRVRAMAGNEYSTYASTVPEKPRSCPEDDPLAKIVSSFREKTYTGDTRPYTQDDIEVWKTAGEDYSDADKKLLARALRNEIYARHGRIFRSRELRRIFESTSWYGPRKDFDESMLNDLEKRNIRSILEYEKQRGWR